MDGLNAVAGDLEDHPAACAARAGQVSLYVFMIAWNEFLLAFMLLDDPSKFTLTRGVAMLNSRNPAPAPDGGRGDRHGAGHGALPGAGKIHDPRADRGRGEGMMDADTRRRGPRDPAGNDRGGYTIPTAGLYPYQWNWDSAFAAWGFSTFDIDRAWAELETLILGPVGRPAWCPHILFWQPDPGYFPGPDVWGTNREPATSGISQPPVAAILARKIHERRPGGGDRAASRALSPASRVASLVASPPLGFRRGGDHAPLGIGPRQLRRTGTRGWPMSTARRGRIHAPGHGPCGCLDAAVEGGLRPLPRDPPVRAGLWLGPGRDRGERPVLHGRPGDDLHPDPGAQGSCRDGPDAGRGCRRGRGLGGCARRRSSADLEPRDRRL
jgi:hypothetical protein